MSVKVIAQLNAFSTEKTEYEFEPQPVSEIIKKIDTNNASNTGWRALFNDEIITDFSRVPADGTTVLLKLVPTGDNQDIGVGMKIGGGALAALGVIVGIAVGWTGVGLTFASTLIGSGVSLLLGGIALYNMDIPSLKDRPSPEQDASIRGSQNQLRQRGYIPVLFGKRRFYADLAMTSYTWVDPSTGSMYLYQLFCAGQKDITIDESSLKIDETLLSSYMSGNNIEYEIAYGEDVPPMFEKCIHEDQVLAILKHSTEDGTDASVIKTTPECTEINVDIFFHNGLAKYNDDGGLADTTVEVKAYYKKADEPDSAYQLLGNFTESGNSITGKELKTKRFAITKSGLDSASYTVKLTRVTADSTNSKVIDDVYVGSIRAIKNELPVSERRCRQLTLLALKIKATEKLNNVVQKLNFVSQSKMPVWDGIHSGPSGWTQSSLTSNPASAAIYAMQSEVAQQRLSSNEIDWQSFERLYTWCNTHEYECNTYVSESMSISQLLTAIGSTCRTEILRMNGKITALMDVERNSSVQLFTPRNSYDYSETIISADIPDALNIGFEDKDSGYAANELYVYNTPSGNKEEEPHTIQDVPLWGVTSSEQARKLGMWKYAVTKNRPFIHSWSCDVEYLMCQKGDRVKYAGDIALIGTTQCRVTECIIQNRACIGIKVDEVIQMQEGVNVVRYRKSNGELKLQTVVFSAEPTKELFFETAPSTVEAPEPDNLVAVGLQDFDTIDLIITDIKCDNNLSAEITAVDYSPEVFGVDSPDFVLPEFKNKISAVPASVDDGIVSANEWKLFFTYHDSASEPAIPEGDGTTNGWHTTPTVESIWVSSKTAEDILSGQWSKPRKTMGQKGDPGEPGRTPSVSVSKTGTVTTINIDGQTSTVNDGENGSDGTKTFYSDYARTWNNTQWNNYSATNYTDTWYNSTIEGMRIGDTFVITATLSEKGNSKGQVFTKITSVPTSKGSSGYYEIPCKTVSSLIGEKGQTGEKALQTTRNWSGTFTTINATATASTTDFNRTPVVGDTFQTLDGSSNYGTWQVTAISGTSVTIKLLSYVVAKGNTGATGAQGTGTWTCVLDGVAQNGSDFTKTRSAGAWDSQVYSNEGYLTAMCSAKAKQTSGYVMFGLNSDPKTNASYTSLDYTFYFSSGGNLSIWENGAQVLSVGTYTVNTVCQIFYDGTNVTYYVDGVLKRTVARTKGTLLYFDSSFHTGGLSSVSFGQYGEKGTNGTSPSALNDVVLSTSQVMFTTTLGGNIDVAQDVYVYYKWYEGTTERTPTVGTISITPSGHTISASNDSTNKRIKLSVAKDSAMGNNNSGEISIPFTYSGKTITKTLKWYKAISKLVVDELNVNKLSSPSFAYGIGFAMNGTTTAMTVNGVTVDANTEYHYGKALYMSDWMKLGEKSYCTAFGRNAGFMAVYQGPYRSTDSYKKTDVVSYNGIGYLCLKDCSNIVPTNTTYWKPIGGTTFMYTNSAFGANALAGVTGMGNSAFGYNTLNSLESGSYNTALGIYAGNSHTGGSYNVNIGYMANGVSKVMNHQMNIDNRLIYLEFKTGVHTQNDVVKCLKKYVPNNNNRCPCLASYRGISSTFMDNWNGNIRFNNDSNTTIYAGSSSALLTNLHIFIAVNNPNDINNIRPTDVS